MTTIDLTFTPATATAAFAANSDNRLLSGPVVPFGEPSNPSADGHRYEFAGPPTNPDELVDVVEDHDHKALIGRLSEPWTVEEVGLSGTARIFATTRGNDVLTEFTEGARTGFSVGAAIAKFTTRPDGVRAVSEWSAVHLGVVRRPAFTTSQITAHTSAQEGPPMPDTKTPPVVELPTIAELAAQVAAQLKADTPSAPLARFGTFEQFMTEFAAADATEKVKLQAEFAVAEQVTSNNPGVMPPTWRTEIKANLDARQPSIRAFGTVPLFDSGLDVSWPYFDGNLDNLVKDQTSELAELESVRVDIKKAIESLKTAGTVTSISYQLLMRSTPAYQAAYLRICMAAWARFNEAKFEAQVLAKGTNVAALPSLASAKPIREALFAASADVEDATGAPADVVLVDRATFVTLGGVDYLHNPKYGTQNAAGTASASTLTIDVNGLQVRRAPFFPASTMVVASSDAAKFSTSGAQIATEENVAKLGRNVAVWGFYVPGEVYFPAGIRVYKPQG